MAIRQPTLAVLACLALAVLARPAVAAEPEAFRNRDLALCVGIEDYPKMDDVPACAKDARSVAARLEESGNFRKIFTLADRDESGAASSPEALPTAANLRSTLTLLANAAGPHDNIFIFFSGRGVHANGVDGLIPADGDAGSAIAVDEIRKIFAPSRARAVLLAVDARRSADGFVNAASPGDPANFGVLASCREGQLSVVDAEYGMGIFAMYLGEGLKGVADLNRDGVITGQELCDYVDMEMSDYCLREGIVASQTPTVNAAGATLPFLRVDLSYETAAPAGGTPSLPPPPIPEPPLPPMPPPPEDEPEGEGISLMGQALDAAENGDDGALADFRAALERRSVEMQNQGGEQAVWAALNTTDRPVIAQLSTLVLAVRDAETFARRSLAAPIIDERAFEPFVERAEDADKPVAALAEQAVELIKAAQVDAENLAVLKEEVLYKLQNETRRGRTNPGTMLAWSTLRVAAGNPDAEFFTNAFKFDANRLEAVLVLDGVTLRTVMKADDFETRVRASALGYTFTAGWAVLFQKPFRWMTRMATDLQTAGVNSDTYPYWEIFEGPGALLALTPANTPGGRKAFFNGALLDVETLPLPENEEKLLAAFLDAAKRLHEGVMADDSISRPLRQALEPILLGAYRPVDPNDYFDSPFCRRLIEADYLETYISPLPPERGAELEAYRGALGKVEAGYDEFLLRLPDGSTLAAVVRPEAALDSGKASDQDQETGESLPRYGWRHETEEETTFFSPMPARFIYSFTLAERYQGRHTARPVGTPSLTEVVHPILGVLASYTEGDPTASGDPQAWNNAIIMDASGGQSPFIGPPGWNFPPHVVVRDDQGDPVLLATANGVVESPDFAGIPDPEERRRAEDEWLDSTANTLSAPGELGLIFHQFFRYCSDSPLPEMPNLIGSHRGLSDTHQTVYQSLERRWVGRLIGDCDDLAEFFQVLTSRQGKLSHVMQLPAHAACGYVEKNDEGGRRFVVLQTGPVLQFNAPALEEVVEMAYRYFDDDRGQTHMTAAAVPLLLRFADEETRTPFVLSARIYEDAEYAQTMIRIQGYWHQHVYSAAIKEMEEMVKTDRDVGNLKELGSLYQRVGDFEKSEELRRQELEAIEGDNQAKLSTLLDIVQLHMDERNKPAALETLEEMGDLMQSFVDANNSSDFFRAMSFRSFWAILLSRLNAPAQAWDLLHYDVAATKRQLGHVSLPVLQTMVVMYDKMAMNRAKDGGDDEIMTEIETEIEDAFARGFFRRDDPYNTTIARYLILGMYAVAKEGREAGIDRLNQDGPYPAAAKDQTRRGRRITEEDWKWFRICPQLYWNFGAEMLDKDEFPELYNPQAAKSLLENVARATEKGAGLGSDVSGSDDVIRSAITLAFINDDLAGFDSSLAVVKEKNYSRLYDHAAMTLGANCDLVPAEEFPKWVTVFRKYFPGKQHYFKVVYRAIDNENYDHARILARMTAEFFPEEPLLVQEAAFVEKLIPVLKERKAAREAAEAEKAKADKEAGKGGGEKEVEELKPAA